MISLLVFLSGACAALSLTVVALVRRIETLERNLDRIMANHHTQYQTLLEMAKAPNAHWYADRVPPVSTGQESGEAARLREEEETEVWDETGLFSATIPPLMRPAPEPG